MTVDLLAGQQIIDIGRRDHGPISLAVAERGEGTAVVFCHGFPELGYSWRHQLDAVSAAGFRAIAPDQRGYGASSAPDAVDAYGITELCGDLDALCETLGIDQAIFVGHDWGGFVAWAMPVLYPQRCLGVVGVCTPYVPFPTTDVLRMLVGGRDDAMYMLWFQEPGVAEAVMDPQASLLFERLQRGGVSPELLAGGMLVDGEFDMNPFRRLESLSPMGERVGTAEDLAVYQRIFGQTGFRGGINWYRNIDRNHAEHPDVGVASIDLPALMVTAEWDPALSPALSLGMEDRCSDLERAMIERAGHWVQQEYPDELNAVLISWLTRRFG